MKILLKYWKEKIGKPVVKFSNNPRKIGQILGRINFVKAYLRVLYPELKKEYPIMPFNDGLYFDKEELQKAFRAFIKEEKKYGCNQRS